MSLQVPTIVTLTLSPALDLATTVETLEPWHKMRCHGMRMDPGGGGVNVARAIRELGGAPIAVVALGGHVGSLLADALGRADIAIRRIGVNGLTRQDFAVTETSTGRQYRFVQPTAAMSDPEWKRCIDVTVDAAATASSVVASGSVPEGVPDDVFVRLAERLDALHVPLIVDTSGHALQQAIMAPIQLAKPSVRELLSLSGVDADHLDGCEAAARRLLLAGRCATIVVSMGESGALFVPRDAESFVVRAPDVHMVSASGAGDSMVAGVALALARGGDLREAARLGVAAGSAAVTAEGTALCHREDVERLLADTVIVEPSELLHSRQM